MSTKLIQRMLTASGKTAKDARAGSEMGDFFREVGIRETSELARIARIPRRNWEDLLADGYGEALSRHLSRPGSRCQLLPAQVAALTEYHDYGGFLGALAIGAGKTLVSLLAPTLAGAEHPVLLIPGGLREKTLRDAERYRADGWLVHPQIRLVSYEEVSRHPDLLLHLAPDHLICDEVSALKNLKKAACAKRVAHLMTLRPSTHFMGLSGTVSTRSLHEFWHLLMWSSRANFMPLPRTQNEVAEWALAVDEKISGHARMMPGALITKLGQGIVVPPATPEHLKELVHARMAVQRRLHETPGFLHTSTLSCPASMSMTVVEPPHSARIEAAITELRESVAREGESTDGTLMLRPADVWAKARMAAQGFLYDWDPPPPDEWRVRRRHWHKVIRFCLAEYSRLVDSPMQVAKAIDRGTITLPIDVSNDDKPDKRKPADVLAAWRAIAPTYKYKLVPRWFDDSRMRWVAQKYLGPKSPACIVWVEHIAVGRKLHELSGRSFHHSGGLDANNVHIEQARGPIIASVEANHKGVNLQQYFRNFIVSAEPTGETWEQCLDAETEILTVDGWLGIDHPLWQKASSRVAAFDITTGEIFWQPGERMERLLGNEKMFGISNPHLDVRVTAGHRMVHQSVRRFGNGGIDGFTYLPNAFVEASKMPSKCRIPVAGEQQGVGVPLTRDDLIFLGLFMSDGNLSRGNNVISIFQSDKYPEIVDLCHSTLAACGFRFKHSKHNRPTNFGERNYSLNRWAISYGKRKDGGLYRGWIELERFVGKSFPSALNDMTAEQLQHFLLGLWAGDGMKTKGTYEYDRYTPGTMTIASNPEAASKIQALCVRRGLRCNLARTTENLHTLHISHDRTWSVMNMRIGDGRARWAELVSSPNERVWCVSVPLGAIVTRRNGKVAIVGNCMGRTHRQGQDEDHVFYEIMQACIEHKEGLVQVLKDAQYAFQTLGQPQRLLLADKINL
jgi:hypothetical protein